MVGDAAQEEFEEMQTREDAAVDLAVRTRRALVGGMGQATVSALWALTGCVALIVVVAAMSICWAVHPLLMVLVAIGMVAVGCWLAGHAMRAGGR